MYQSQSRSRKSHTGPGPLGTGQGLQKPVHLGQGVGEPLDDPAVGGRSVGHGDVHGFKVFQVHHDEPAGVPNFVGEVPGPNEIVVRHLHVAAGGRLGDQREPQGVGAELFHDVQGVNHVVERLGHFPALFVPHDAVNEDVSVRDVVPKRQPHHDHPGHPQVKNFVAGGQHRGGVMDFKGVGFVGPAQGGEGPKAGRKPGVQHVRITHQVFPLAMGAVGRRLGLNDGPFEPSRKRDFTLSFLNVGSSRIRRNFSSE
jgi:hypothetical protein